MARKFFCVCAGMLMLALVYHLRATTAGALASGLPGATEVSVLTGFVRNGDIIPLPTYADGTTALESECHWSLSPLYIPVAYNWCYTAAAIFGQPPRASPTAPFDNLPFYSGLPPRPSRECGSVWKWFDQRPVHNHRREEYGTAYRRPSGVLGPVEVAIRPQQGAGSAGDDRPLTLVANRRSGPRPAPFLRRSGRGP